MKKERPLDVPLMGNHLKLISHLQERKDDFLRELRNTICNWVYSKSQYNELLKKELKKRGLDPQNAASHIESLARSKFRRNASQGQFGELLLFNFLQFFFKAPPLLRKMSITTNPDVERHGADAIHYKPEGAENKFYLGESKAYTSKYKFNTALNESVASIINTYNNLQKELLLYVYDEFIDPNLQGIAEKFKEGTLDGVKIELVCLVSYNETISIKGISEELIKQNIQKVILERFGNADTSTFEKIDDTLLKRFHYIILPFWDFDDILKEFTN